jgi:SAM-dependent methyltransferase
MLELARVRRSHPAITYQRRDLRTIRPDLDGRFDLVLSAYALHHIADLEHTLRQVRDLVAPGGRVILIDNVAATHAVPRSWFVTEATRMLAGDLLRRRRPLREAVELFRLNTDPAWLDHQASDRFLHPVEFAERYRAVFPGAAFTDLYRARVMCWDAPDQPSPPQAGP